MAYLLQLYCQDNSLKCRLRNKLLVDDIDINIRRCHMHWFYIKVIPSSILRNKSTLVMGICITFTCFQTLCPRKRGFLHETGFSLTHQSIPLWWSKFFQIERNSNTIFTRRNSVQCGEHSFRAFVSTANCWRRWNCGGKEHSTGDHEDSNWRYRNFKEMQLNL